MGRKPVRIVAHEAELRSAIPYRAIIRPVLPHEVGQMEVQGQVMCSTGSWRQGTWMFGHGDRTDCYLAPPCFPDGEIYLAEDWATERRLDSCAPSAIPADHNPLIWRFDTVWYESGDESSSVGRWRQARHMPVWASRRRIEIGEVVVRRLLELTDADLLNYGLPCDIGKFLSDWDSHYGGSPSAAENNPLCWVMIEDGQFCYNSADFGNEVTEKEK